MTTSQETEALRKRHTYRASVTPLSDGSFAVFAIDLSIESLLIVRDLDDLGLAISSRANMPHRVTRSKDEPPPPPRRRRVLDFDDVFDKEGLE